MRKAKQTIEINGKTINLRVYTRNVAALNEKLGTNLQDAVVQIFDNPALFAPVLQACMAGKDDLPDINEAYDVVDALIDQGFTPDKLMELAIDVGENSGFFTGSRAVTMRTLPAKLIKMSDQMDNKLATGLDETIQKLTKTASKESSKPAALPA